MPDEQLDLTDLLAGNEVERRRTKHAGSSALEVDPRQMTLTGAGELLTVGSDLRARLVWPHSLVKAARVNNYGQTAVRAVGGRFKIWWLELFAGPGLLWDRAKGQVTDGSPLQALKMDGRIDGFVFADNSPECHASLLEVVAPYRGGQRRIHVLKGDANDSLHLQLISELMPSDALVIAYLDPEGLDLHWETIRLLAWRFKRFDLLLNLPVPAIDRCMSAGTLPNIARVTKVLGHSDPAALLRGAVTRDAIRVWFTQQLRGLGYHQPTGHVIPSESKHVAQYDILLASRDELGAQLYDRANRNAPGGQRGLDLAG